MKIASLDSPPVPVQRQEAVKHEAQPQPEAKPAEQGLGFISPVIHVDSQAGVAILQYRDSATGDVTSQIPSEKVVQRYREGEVVAHHGQSSSSGSPSATGGETTAAVAPTSSTQGEGGSGTSTGGSGGESGGESAKG